MEKKEVLVKWTGDKQFIGTDSGNHSIVISSHDEANNTGMSPSQLLLLALASCSAYDVVNILQKKRLQLNGLDITVRGEQEPDPPWTYRQLHLKFVLDGPDLTDKAVEQAIELSLTKYCAVAATVSGKAEVTHEFEILGK
jgi:putative redox protein